MQYSNELGKFHFEIHGRADAPVIVFTHGVTMESGSFDAQVEALKSTYRVVVWDMPFHGKSTPIERSLPFGQVSADLLIELLDHLGVEQTVLAGVSMGSMVTQRAAAEHPHRIRALIHIGGFSLYPGRSKALKMLKPFLTAAIALYPERALARSFAKQRTLTEEARAYLERVVASTGKAALRHVTNAMVDEFVRGIDEPLRHPQLLICGDHEMPFVRKNAERVARVSPNAELVVIEDAHHLANQDNPQAVNAVISSFLASLE